MFKVSFWNGSEVEVYGFYAKESYAQIASLDVIRKGFTPEIEEVTEDEVTEYYMKLLQ